MDKSLPGMPFFKMYSPYLSNTSLSSATTLKTFKFTGAQNLEGFAYLTELEVGLCQRFSLFQWMVCQGQTPECDCDLLETSFAAYTKNLVVVCHLFKLIK
jgi:hypothetical protein